MPTPQESPELTEQSPPQPYDKEMREAGQLTSPTWELELFLSGALVFAMFQLPGAVEGLFGSIEPHVAGATRTVVGNLGLYAKAIAYTLLITFSVHLIGRAQWVALMGLQSVFPNGIKWEALKGGPMGQELYKSRTPALTRAIARLDNFCSIIFSVGMLFVLLFIYSATLVGVMGGLGWVMARAFTQGHHTDAWFLGLVLVFVAIPTTAAFVDKRWGARIALDPGSRRYRVLHAWLRFAYSINLMRLAGPMMWTLMSNVGRAKAVAAMYTGLMIIMFIAAADILVRRGALSVNGYEFYGISLEHGVSGAQYESQRPKSAPARTPMIQSDIIRDPYIKLFIPYSPQRHNVAMARECPGLRPLQTQGLQFGAEDPVPDSLALPALQCLAKIHQVTLDGAARPDLEFFFYEHPGTGLRGILAYIAADSLARGRHVLTVMPVPPPTLPTDSADLANALWKRPYVIPFWK